MVKGHLVYMGALVLGLSVQYTSSVLFLNEDFFHVVLVMAYWNWSIYDVGIPQSKVLVQTSGN